MRRVLVGALAAGVTAAAVAVPFVHTSPPPVETPAAWKPPATTGPVATEAAPRDKPVVLPSKVSKADPVTVVRTTLDPDGRPVVTTTRATDRAAAERLLREGQGAELDSPVHALDAPAGTDPLRADQWDLAKVRVPAAWPVSTGAGQVVAVLDTGVDATHPDLIGQVLPGLDLVDGSSDGGIDPQGHGTHVAGTIAAATGNGVGMSAIAPDARILPVRVLNAEGEGDMSVVAQGITWAADHGATVINMSLGGPGQLTAVSSAIAYARSKGVVVVAAAGNSRAKGNAVNYPAADAGVIAVAATDPADAYASFSNSGSYVDVAAPGVNILSTVPTGTKYGYASGTSMAAPHVAALAALVGAARPGLTPDQVEQAITGSAVDLGAKGKDTTYGYGRIDAPAALAVVTDPPMIRADAKQGTVSYGSTVRTTFTVTAGGQPWSSRAANVCIATKCSPATTSSTGTVVVTHKATASFPLRLIVAGRSATQAWTVRSTAKLTRTGRTTLAATLGVPAGTTVRLQKLVKDKWVTVSTLRRNTGRASLTRLATKTSYRMVVTASASATGVTSNTVRL